MLRSRAPQFLIQIGIFPRQPQRRNHPEHHRTFSTISSRMPQKNRCDYPRTLRNSGGVKNLRLR